MIEPRRFDSRRPGGVLDADGTVPAQRPISKVVPLTEAPAAFGAPEGGGDVMKILVDCSATGTAGGTGNTEGAVA